MIKIHVNEKMQWIVTGREMHEFLGVGAKYNDWFDRMTKYGFVDGTDFVPVLKKSTGGRPRYDHNLSIDMAANICRITRRNDKAATLYRYLEGIAGKEKVVVLPSRKEIVFGETLKSVLDGIVVVEEQKRVMFYRLDFYIPFCRMAIEYDEGFHKCRREEDAAREGNIKNVLNCDFVRVLEGQEILGINEIFKKITEQLREGRENERIKHTKI